MPYCPNCGNQVDETVAFCPRCGTSLKGAASPEPTPPEHFNLYEKPQNQEAPVPEKVEKKEKTEHGFIGYLMGGLILVTIGIFGLFDLTNPANSSQDLGRNASHNRYHHCSRRHLHGSHSLEAHPKKQSKINNKKSTNILKNWLISIT